MLRRLPQIPTVQALWSARDPDGFFRAKSGGKDLFTIRMPGIAPIHATGTREGAKQIFSAPADTFASVKGSPIEPLLGRHSMMVLDGERHARERRLMMPCFSLDKLSGLAQRIARVVEDQWAATPCSTPIELNVFMQSLTLKIIIDVIFGVTDPLEKDRFIKVTEAFLYAYTPTVMLVPPLRNYVWRPWRRFKHAQEAFDKALLDLVKKVRQGHGAAVGSMLDILQSARSDDGAMFTDKELRDELRTLLVAGHETSATGLTWALYYTLQRAQVYGRLQSELQSSDRQPMTMSTLPYLAAVCHEALRLHPVVPLAIRTLTKPMLLCGEEIPAGENVAVILTLLHSDPSLYSEPKLFEPQRFLDRKFAPHEFAPFGGGFRRCIGASFAQMEMRVALGTLLGRGDLQLIGDPQPKMVIRNITTGPHCSIHIQKLRR